MDHALAGAHLVDLSFQGAVDTDVRNVIRAPIHTPRHAASPALALLDAQGGVAPLDATVEAIVARIGDLRAAILEALQARGFLSCEAEPVIWGFLQQRVTAEAGALRHMLTALIEGEELPSPEEAALVSLLHAAGMTAEMLAMPRSWPARHKARIEALHRMDLVGQGVSATISVMRDRLRVYLLRSGAKGPAGATWEWRCFWPGDAATPLPAALDLLSSGDEGREEQEADVYLFVRGKRDNIKFRGKGLKVKPVIEAFDEFCAFGPSDKVNFPLRAEALSGAFPRFNEVQVKLRTREDMLQALAASGYRPGVVRVSKRRRQYRALLGVKIELAQIEVKGRLFQSLSLESRFLTALRVLSRNVAIGPGVVGGYAEFLERLTMGRV
jgi:hypothetical protein